MVNAFDALAAGAKREATPSANSVPWLEKYRPKTLDDLVGNEDAVARMRAMVSSGFATEVDLFGTSRVREDVRRLGARARASG